MRSKQNKLKRKISRGQKAGRPLKDLEKRVEEAISKIKHIETACKSNNSQPKIWTVDMVQKSREAVEHLNDVKFTLQAVLHEIRGGNPFRLQCVPDPRILSIQRNIIPLLQNVKRFIPDEYTKLLNDPERRAFIEELLDKEYPGKKLSDLSENDD